VAAPSSPSTDEPEADAWRRVSEQLAPTLARSEASTDAYTGLAAPHPDLLDTMNSLLPVRSCLLLLSLTLTAPVVPTTAQAPDPDPTRFSEAIAHFDHWDSQNAYPENGVLLVGSSSIVRWSTAERFPGLPVINRGFGGSHISDVNHYVEETVLRYAPDVVVFYAGNNDITAGKTPEQVFSDYQRFARSVLDRFGRTQILFISIHPSVLRWENWPEMREANDRIAAYSATDPRLHYVDISLGMLGPDGRPIPGLFVEDGLHLSPAGYDVWTPIVRRAIDSARTEGAIR